MDNLKIVQSLDELPVWMKESSTRSVMHILNQNGLNAMFVGGCVRNQLIGAHVDDIDIACKLPPEEVMSVLQAADIKVIPTGIDHGTVTAVSGDRSFEITTLRRDEETDGRRAVVAYSDDWIEDAKRRDFTMNTLLADMEGNIYDPLGSGLEALEAGRIEFVGNAAKRIKEDHLRILRFFRFFALYGEGVADEIALKACRAGAEHVYSLSKERITQEFFKILAADKAPEILALMFENDVLRKFAFEDFNPEEFSALCYFQKNYSLVSVATRLFSLGAEEKEAIKAMQDYLLIPKVFQKDIQALSLVLSSGDFADEHAVKVAVYKYGRTASAQGLMMMLAQDKVMNAEAPDILNFIQTWDIPTFPISGQDLINDGMKPGPELGAKLDQLEQEWINNGFKS